MVELAPAVDRVGRAPREVAPGDEAILRLHRGRLPLCVLVVVVIRGQSFWVVSRLDHLGGLPGVVFLM